ncbi:uncharacterized protein PAC_15941 [Phialocephala subalpina]|uniref:Uncharacterized protein n=1 Tax=Phialocephala subalpina TaxID=576137 RepID=A0A1L7XLV5_9HELO|nr:uncharacterized protein PAC_15941 [Phialocephala subalpina]
MLISSIFGYTEALKITLLSVLLAEYLGIFIAYLVRLRGLSSRIYSVILWSTMLCCVAWVGAFASLVCFLTGRVDFITSLWIDNAAAMVWVMWLLWNQWKGLQRAQSPKEGSGREDPRSLHEELGVLQSDLLRQDSMTQLVAPSARGLHLPLFTFGAPFIQMPTSTTSTTIGPISENRLLMINSGILSIIEGLAITSLGIFILLEGTVAGTLSTFTGFKLISQGTFTILKGLFTILAGSIINIGLLFTIPYNLFFWIIALPFIILHQQSSSSTVQIPEGPRKRQSSSAKN